MDFIAEEELCQQAYAVWLQYASPACKGFAQQNKGLSEPKLSSPSDGPCSLLPLIVFSAFIDRGESAGRAFQR